MPHGPTKISSKGFCIYCGDSDSTLSDEHIVPLALGGQHVIKNASCGTCAKITSAFELDVSRGLWGDARISYDAPSRRKRQRKSHIQLPEVEGQQPLAVPYSEYPAPLVFYHMWEKADVLQGLRETNRLSWKLVTLHDDKRIREFQNTFELKMIATFKHVPISFGRMLAKIAYGHTLCSLDPTDFNPICVPYILGSNENVSFIVGGANKIDEPELGIGYRLDNCAFGDDERWIITATIRLFAHNSTPTYHVVVGDVSGVPAVNKVKDKLQAGCAVELAKQDFPPNDFFHWLPLRWPIAEFKEGSMARRKF